MMAMISIIEFSKRRSSRLLVPWHFEYQHCGYWKRKRSTISISPHCEQNPTSLIQVLYKGNMRLLRRRNPLISVIQQNVTLQRLQKILFDDSPLQAGGTRWRCTNTRHHTANLLLAADSHCDYHYCVWLRTLQKIGFSCAIW